MDRCAIPADAAYGVMVSCTRSPLHKIRFDKNTDCCIDCQCETIKQVSKQLLGSGNAVPKDVLQTIKVFALSIKVFIFD